MAPEPTPTPATIQAVWKALMSQLAHRNTGYAVGSNQARYALHALMRSH